MEIFFTRAQVIWVVLMLLLAAPMRAAPDAQIYNHVLLPSTIRVAVATNFKPAFDELAALFAADYAVSVQASFGSTGKLYAQILQGAPFDVFMAADQERPRKLIDKGVALESSVTVYAEGRIALWQPPEVFPPPRLSRTPSGADSSVRVTATPNSPYQHAEKFKADSAVSRASCYEPARRVVIANPKTAPFGVAAQEALQKLEAWRLWRPRLLQAQSISQAFQFIQSGNAEMGLVSYSQLLGEGVPISQYWLVPGRYHKPILLVAVQIPRGVENPAAAAWLTFLKTCPARSVIAKYGYDLPRRPSTPANINVLK